MKPTVSAQLGQQLHLTPQLLQSIRLLQLDGLQLEMEIRRALENNPLLELEEPEAATEAETAVEAVLQTAAFDDRRITGTLDVGCPGHRLERRRR